ncbi:hypothetical protein Dvina_53690 [Dactylosporangium vinaceum]|uniref:Uncharacterized protein n=1 Tax=Dactylosporangium vinaceum TaxID=53362 RepID=A0ABV5MPW5_9ACTN|nr:hypothetical protein [Dactylosporangium vinaceum]UAB96650.1 hypothetical protein Dvina_53690 [Dactylosporangium vinaceum]
MSGHRTAVRLAATAAAIAAAALTVGAGPVSAAPETPSIEFSGGSVLSLLVCKSEPNTGNVSVPSDSRVNFVNRLGQDASLKVDGRSVATVQPNQQVPVLFKKGPVEVAMTFDCGVGVVQQFKPVSVGVTTPPPSAGGATAQAAQPQAKAPGAVKTTGPANGPAGAAAGAANGVITNRSGGSRSAKTPTATPGAAGSAGADSAGETGTEPIDPALIDPSAAAAPAVGVDPSAPVDDRVTVEQPVAASGPASNGPAGLLALVATVCVVGVGIAAIRAIIAQRASRASFA